MILTDFIPIVLAPVLRSVGGWLENALEDNKIDMIEWRQLGSTVLRVGIMGIATFFGLNGLGIDISGIAAGGSAIVLDFILNAIKKK
jgi:small-conductance mechanosensitive channel